MFQKLKFVFHIISRYTKFLGVKSSSRSDDVGMSHCFNIDGFEVNFGVLIFLVFHQCLTIDSPVFYQCFAVFSPVFWQCSGCVLPVS